MLSGIHFLLTYTCTFECDHCFLHCGPHSPGTFTGEQLRRAFDQIADLGTVTNVYFEGGEPFLFYPLMVEGVRLARAQGLDVGIVTNAYWATSVEDATVWLKPLHKLGISDLSLSDDAFHHGGEGDSPAQLALAAAKKLGMESGTICIEASSVETDAEKGTPIVGGGVKFKGRAAEKLTDGLPTRAWRELRTCPYENLESPGRVHVDSYGNVMLCQGLNMGNMWQEPLASLDRRFDPTKHPVIGPLIEGGPAMLAERYGVAHDKRYVDECHFCYEMRKALLDVYPQYLAPRQVYGLT